MKAEKQLLISVRLQVRKWVWKVTHAPIITIPISSYLLQIHSIMVILCYSLTVTCLSFNDDLYILE